MGLKVYCHRMSEPARAVYIFLQDEWDRFLLSRRSQITFLQGKLHPLSFKVLDEKDIDRILGPHKKVQQWVEDTKNATKPHSETKAELQKLKLGAA